jgi:hypothetical protein
VTRHKRLHIETPCRSVLLSRSLSVLPWPSPLPKHLFFDMPDHRTRRRPYSAAFGWLCPTWLRRCWHAFSDGTKQPLSYSARCSPLLAIAAFVGISFTYSGVSQQRVADQQVKDAVQPGEDPNHGPAAMRNSGAEMGAAIGSGLVTVLAVAIPPVQTAVIAIPTIFVGVLYRVRRAHLRQTG